MVNPSSARSVADTTEVQLQTSLGRRQMSMIAIGGVIGAGLFVGSGSAISMAGPGVILAYVVVGAIVVLVMRMLAEMAVAQPETGSFSSYASRELGSWAGLAVGWLYAYQWCITVGFEAIAAAAITEIMFPAIPSWLAALVFMTLMIAVNLSQVKNFGEFEFWFALVKVVAIIAFLILGLIAILGLFPGVPAPGLDNLTGQGGFFPNGGLPILLAMLVVFFSFFGTEVVTIAAGEATDPVSAVKTAMNSVVWRILLFYIGSMLIVVTLLPWNAAEITQSPYVAVLDRLGIPYASTIMNLVVLTAVLSCLNAGIYASSRMLYSLSSRGEGPKLLTRTSRHGVPVYAVFAASSVGLLTVVANYFLPTAAVFNFLLASSGSIAVIVYLCITVTQIRGRTRLERTQPGTLTVKMWAHPFLSIVVAIALLAIIGGMAATSATRQSLFLTLTVTVIAVAAGIIHQRRQSRRERQGQSGPPPTHSDPVPSSTPQA